MRAGDKLPHRIRGGLPDPVTMTQQLQVVFRLTEQKSSLSAEGAAQPLVFQNSDGLTVTGNNGKTEVRFFHKDTNIGPYTENFIDRGRSIFEAALILLNLPKGRLPPELMTLWDNFAQQIKNTCNIDPDEMTQLIDQPTKTEKYFNQIYERALYLLGQLCTGLIGAIKAQPKYTETIKEKDEDSFKYAKAALRKQETELIKSKGRSNLVNVIDIDDVASPTQVVTCLSTVTSTTTPSNINSEGNRNLVREDRYIKIGQRLIKVGNGIRLGAISSFGEKNEIMRKSQNADNAQELLQVAAAEKITSDGLNVNSYSSENTPLKINIFSSTLLSPYKEYLAEFFDMLDLIPSELQMLQEHHEALMLYHNRTFPLEITLNNGVKKTIYIQPNIMHFNIPANINTELQHELISEDQDNINAQGGFEYLRQAERYLKDQWLSENQLPSEMTSDLKKDVAQCKKNLNKVISIIGENKEFIARLKSLDDKLAFLNQRLAYENRLALESLNHIKTNPADQSAIAKYQQHIKEIQRLNGEINKSYREIYEAYHHARKQPVIIMKGNIRIETIDVTELFKRNYENIESLLKNKKEFFSKPENFAIKQQLLTALAYINAQRMMFDEDPNLSYKYKENALLMLAYMHTIMQASSAINSYGCKSAKDRTGLLTNYKDAITIFAEQFGVYPDPLNKGHCVQLQNIISHLIYQTPSALNSAQNDPGAYGLQIHKPYIAANAMGLLAKGAYSAAVRKTSVLLSKLNQNDSSWHKAILPHIKSLIELDMQFALSGLKNKELARKIMLKQNELKQLCDLPDLFENVTSWSVKYLAKDEKTLKSIIESKLLEKEILAKIAEEQHDKQAKDDKELARGFQSGSHKLTRKVGSKEEYKLDMIAKELDYLHALLAENRIITNTKTYLASLNDVNLTEHIIHKISQLERYELADMKKILWNIQTEVEKMNADTIGSEKLLQVKNNLERCDIALLIQEAKFNGVLPNHIENITNKNETTFLLYQMDLFKKALDYLWTEIEKVSSERKMRKNSGQLNSIMLETSLKDMMSYMGNLQGYLRVLSDAKMKLDEKQKMVRPPVTEEKVEQSVPRAQRQRIFSPDARKIETRQPTNKP